MKIRIAKEDLVKALKKVIGGIGVGGKDLDYLKITARFYRVWNFMTTGRFAWYQDQGKRTAGKSRSPVNAAPTAGEPLKSHP